MPLHETVNQSSQLRCSALLYSPEIQLPSDFSCAHLTDNLHRCPSYCWSHLLLLIILVTILCESCHVTLPSRLKAPCDVSTSYFYWEASWLFHDSCPKNLQWSLFTAEWQAALNSLFKDLNFQLLFFLEKICFHEHSVFHSTMTNIKWHFTSNSCSMNACSPLHSSKFAWHPSCHNGRSGCSSVLQ